MKGWSNRQFEFRGKHLSNSAWYYGKPFEADGDYHLQVDDGCLLIKPSTLTQYIGIKDQTTWAQLTESERERWVLGGNLPSNWQGKEIYEGDIQKTAVANLSCNRGETEYICVVEWNVKQFAISGAK